MHNDERVVAVRVSTRDLLRHATIWIVAAQLLALFIGQSQAQEAPSPVALLRGVEAARTEYSSLKATLEIQYLSPPPKTKIDCLVEMDGLKRRFEVFAKQVPGQVIIRDGDEFHGFVRKEHEDVEIYDVERAVGVRGDVAFDPRVLGLSDTMSCSISVRDCLWYTDSERLETVGQESLRGLTVWRVKATRGDTTMEYWIEEPSFRVHRKTAEMPEIHIEVDSEFETDEAPLPRRVHAKRTYSGQLGHVPPIETIYSIKSIELGADIPADRFTLSSMELPLNTAVLDYRISRIVGYWNGEGLSATPVYLGERPPKPTAPVVPAAQRGPLVLIALNVLVVFVIAVIWWWRTRRPGGSS